MIPAIVAKWLCVYLKICDEAGQLFKKHQCENYCNIFDCKPWNGTPRCSSDWTCPSSMYYLESPCDGVTDCKSLPYQKRPMSCVYFGEDDEGTGFDGFTRYTTVKLPSRKHQLDFWCPALCSFLDECMLSQLQTMCLNDGSCLGLYDQKEDAQLCYHLGRINTC
jgi:hypothetical protein